MDEKNALNFLSECSPLIDEFLQNTCNELDKILATVIKKDDLSFPLCKSFVNNFGASKGDAVYIIRYFRYLLIAKVLAYKSEKLSSIKMCDILDDDTMEFLKNHGFDDSSYPGGHEIIAETLCEKIEFN